MMAETAGVRDQDFVHRDASGAIRFLQQQLRQHTAQRIRQHRAHLRLLVRGKDVDHAIDRLARVVRVQRSEDEQAGLRGGERERDRFQIAHFADEHDVGVFAQRGFKRDRETSRNRSALRAA